MRHWPRLIGIVLLFCSGAAQAASPQASADDYRRAELYLPWNIDKHVRNADPGHHWIGSSHRLWYKRDTSDGHEFILVDVDRRTKTPVFDHDRMARALTNALSRAIDPNQLPIESLDFTSAQAVPSVLVEGKNWTCDLAALQCAGATVKSEPGDAVTPDGTKSLFVKNHNLWMRDARTGQTRPLTRDGDADRSYAILSEASTSEIGWRRQGRKVPPVGVFSPDGRHFVTYRLDQSKVKPLQLLQHVPEDGSVRPIVHTYRYAFPGDVEAGASFFIFDLDAGTAVPVDLPAVAAASEGPIAARYVLWSEDGRKIHLLNLDRSYRTLSLTEIDARSGKTRLLHSETETINYLPSHILPDPPLVRVLAGGDIIWPSERSGFLHLYLYDGRTGRLKNKLTAGDWTVREIIRIDERAKMLYFTAIGRTDSPNPYYRSFWRVKLDGSGLKRLTDGEADHLIKVQGDPVSASIYGGDPSTPATAAFSADGAYFVDSASTPVRPTTTVVRDKNGKLVTALETASLGPALSSYHPPEPFQALADDGKTPIYGLLLKPSNFDPAKSYPVIDSIYPGPQVVRTPTRFMDDRMAAQGVAELGFIVVLVDGRGTPLRSREFRSFSYGNMGAAGTLADHVAAIRQLGASRPWMDLDKVGIYGTSGGGFATVHALFDHPDFFKVGVASAGNHDQRAYLSIWGEVYHGPFDEKGYEAIASYRNVANFKGKLLLAHGDMDDNVHPANTMRVVDQLIKHNKPFDLLIMPNVDHGISGQPYFVKRLWDYFLVNLKGEEPPVDFVLEKPKQ